MTSYTEYPKIPPGQEISIKFLEKLKKIYDQYNAKESRLRLRIEINFIENKERHIREYSSFEEILTDNLPENIKFITINFSTDYYSKESLSFNLKVDKDMDFYSECSIKSKDDSKGIKLKKQIEELFSDSKTNYSWLYSLKRIPLNVISLIVPGMILYIMHSLLWNNISAVLQVIFIMFALPIFALLFIILRKIIMWIYPATDFKFRDKVSDKKKGLRVFIYAILLFLIEETIRRLFFHGGVK